MARPKPEEISSAGQDSFLDVVTNIVGILIILVMVVGGRVGQMGLNAVPKAEAKAEELARELGQLEVELATAENGIGELAAQGRAIEIAAACEDALELARAWTRPQTDSTASFSPRAAVGSHATEAPRGLLWHRYSIDADGLVSGAAIIPPTSQNQARIEADLRAFVPQVLPLDDAAATLRCEQLIRSYDPCISCATHFLRLSIDRKEASVIPPSPSPPRRG